MIVITLLIGIACSSAIDAPTDKCNPPNTQYSVAVTQAAAAEDLKTCNDARDKLLEQMRARGVNANALIYCDQRQIPFS